MRFFLVTKENFVKEWFFCFTLVKENIGSKSESFLAINNIAPKSGFVKEWVFCFSFQSSANKLSKEVSAKMLTAMLRLSKMFRFL